MKISDGLLLLKDLGEEVGRLRNLAKAEGWEFRTTEANAKWVPSFDLDANMKAVKDMTKLSRRLSKAISRANQTVDLPGIEDKDYAEWL